VDKQPESAGNFPLWDKHSGNASLPDGIVQGGEQQMSTEHLRSPVSFLQDRLDLDDVLHLSAYETWWNNEGARISEAIDRAGTPWLRMFDRNGNRVDEILFPSEYRRMLMKGYAEGVVWRALQERSLLTSLELLYIVSFYDPGLACPYTVSLSTALPLSKYGGTEVQDRFLPQLLREDDTAWQGATWMTEIKGGSDLGAAVETTARQVNGAWQLTGDKYFASNAGAELAVVAAHIEGAPQNVRGLGLFLVPRFSSACGLNYFIRRLKDKIATRSVPTGEIELRDSEAYLLGQDLPGIYLILEVLNISRVANSIGSVALAQRAIADAVSYAGNRTAFGAKIINHPLLRHQIAERLAGLDTAFTLAWEAARLLNEVWHEQPPYSDRYHLFRLVAHLAKYWTAEFAAQIAKWAMEVHGGIGTLQEYGAERWLREAMILAIWEGTSHRQILDGLEVMERKAAHRLLLDHLSPYSTEAAVNTMRARIEQTLALPTEERQIAAEPLFRDLAVFTGEMLSRAGTRARAGEVLASEVAGSKEAA
jgi:alkylation response protein AidB-like acyl-CoA dehydrogenase